MRPALWAFGIGTCSVPTAPYAVPLTLTPNSNLNPKELSPNLNPKTRLAPNLNPAATVGRESETNSRGREGD